VNGYSIALFVHLLSLLLACVAATLTTFAALRLRAAGSVGEAMPWIALTGRLVVVFPMASLGLLASGVYMTLERWTWSVPWIDAALAGLGLIMVLGAGVEGSRGRALRSKLESSGMTPAARRLLRDPVAWSAKMTTLTLSAAVVFLMTVKPAATGCASALLVAVLLGVVGAVPMWLPGGARPSGPMESASS